MSSFVEDLWSSVFTPGPTPTLVVATNATFAALQVLLFVLLIATFSIHFLVLSLLSGGLWWSINWFAREVYATQPSGDEKGKQQQLDEASNLASVGAMKPPGAIDTSESETETETVEREKQSRVAAASTPLDQDTAASASLHAPSEGHLRKRPSIGGDSSEHGSTDSEWEKVDANNSA